MADVTGSSAVTWHDREIEAYSSGRRDATAEVRKQARAYLEAKYGDAWETMTADQMVNWVERWILALSADDPELAAECMSVIVTGIKAKQAQDAEAARNREIHGGRPPLIRPRRYDG